MSDFPCLVGAKTRHVSPVGTKVGANKFSLDRTFQEADTVNCWGDDISQQILWYVGIISPNLKVSPEPVLEPINFLTLSVSDGGGIGLNH